MSRFMELRARGWSIAAAGREVGVSRSAAANWARGYKVYRNGQVVGFVEPLDRLAVKAISPRYLSQDERILIAELRPLFSPADPADRTTYSAGEIVQCDLWFPGKVVPVGRVLTDPPVLTMVAAYSGFIMALLLPTRTTGDLVAGMWQLLTGLGAVPKILVWDNESGIGQHRRLTLGARSFAGM